MLSGVFDGQCIDSGRRAADDFRYFRKNAGSRDRVFDLTGIDNAPAPEDDDLHVRSGSRMRMSGKGLPLCMAGRSSREGAGQSGGGVTDPVVRIFRSSGKTFAHICAIRKLGAVARAVLFFGRFCDSLHLYDEMSIFYCGMK